MIQHMLRSSSFKETGVLMLGLLIAIIAGHLLSFTLLDTKEIHAGGFALESTQLENREFLQEILLENTEINAQTEQVMNDVMRQLEIIEEDNVEQWEISQEKAREVVNNMADFVASGFDGDPAFVQSAALQQRDAAATAGRLNVQNMDTSGPFGAQVQQAAARVYQRTLSGDRPSAPGVQGDWWGQGGQQGMQNFRQIVENPAHNTAAGAIGPVLMDLQRDMRAAVDLTANKYQATGGFRSLQECRETGGERICNVKTPGTIISDVYVNALDKGMESLIQADTLGQDFDQDMEEMFVRLGEKALTGASGLLGLDQLLGSNLQSLINDFSLNPSEFIMGLIDQLINSGGGGGGGGGGGLGGGGGAPTIPSDDVDEVDPQLISQVRDTIENVYDVYQAYTEVAVLVIGELGRLPADEEATQAMLIFGMDTDSALNKMIEETNELTTLLARVDTIAQDAAERGTSQSRVLSEILDDFAQLNQTVPRQVDVEILEDDLEALLNDSPVGEDEGPLNETVACGLDEFADLEGEQIASQSDREAVISRWETFHDQSNGSNFVRFLQPGDIATQDFRELRLNVGLDEDNIVTSIDCG